MQYVCLIAASFLVVFGGVNGQLAGGLTDQKASEYTSSAWKSVPEINGQNNGQTYLVPIKVVKAQTQVVAGTNTILEVLVGESTCAKDAFPEAKKVTSANCHLKSDGQRSLYKVSIWEKPWENFTQITAEKIRDVKPSETF